MSVIVESAISQLRELEEAMKYDKSNFRQDDIENCDKLAQLLHNLEKEVKNKQEELEAETIRTNVFRHKLAHMSSNLKNELIDNVKAARDSNMNVILSLKEKLDELAKNIQSLNEQDERLSSSIKSMEIEKKSLESNHENIILSLNDKMADKAKAQIHLNESRDLLREINQSIIELEEDMIDLKEKLIKEKADARDEKMRLEEDRYNTITKAAQQEEINKDKLRELDGVKNKLKESDVSLRTIYRENERLEQLNAQMTSDIELGTIELDKAQRDFESLVLESLRLTALEAQTQQDYANNKTDTINKTNEATERSHIEAENLKNLKEVQETTREELKKIYDQYNELQKLINTIKKAIEEMKQEIGKYYEEMAEIEVKSQTLLTELGKAQDIHNQVTDSMHRELEELKEQLTHSRELRMRKQQERDEKLTEIESFNATYIIFQSNVAQYLSYNKTRTKELNEKQAFLTERIKFNEQEKERLKKELLDLKTKYNKLKTDSESRIKQLNADTEKYKNENRKLESEVAKVTPGYNALCKQHALTLKEFEDTKLHFIHTKNQKTTLESEIEELRSNIKMHDESRDNLKTTLSEKRQTLLGSMKSNHDELIKLENVILCTGLKVQTLKTENEKFITAIKDYEIDYKDIDLMLIEEMNDKDKLQQEYDRIQAQLTRGWREDAEIQRLFAEDDQKLVGKYGEFLDRTRARESHLNSVKNGLLHEIGIVDDYIQKIIGKQPEEQQPLTDNQTSQ